jgi:hydrogenase expression/formation protein HypC
MCLAVPMKIVRLRGTEALVSQGGLKTRADVRFIDQPRVGDYVMVHAGFAIERIKPGHARETLAYLRELEEQG